MDLSENHLGIFLPRLGRSFGPRRGHLSRRAGSWDKAGGSWAAGTFLSLGLNFQKVGRQRENSLVRPGVTVGWKFLLKGPSEKNIFQAGSARTANFYLVGRRGVRREHLFQRAESWDKAGRVLAQAGPLRTASFCLVLPWSVRQEQLIRRGTWAKKYFSGGAASDSEFLPRFALVSKAIITVLKGHLGKKIFFRRGNFGQRVFASFCLGQ